MRGSGTIAILAVGLSCGPSPIGPRAQPPPPDPGHSQAVGRGHVLTRPVDGEPVPGDERGRPVTPKVTEGFAGPPTSNTWWSSLIWQFDPGGERNPYSQPMYPHPLALQAEAGGLGVSYPSQPEVTDRGYFYRHRRDLLVGAEGLAAPDTRVAGYSDWAVTASWQDGARAMTATFGHGLPFVYVELSAGAGDAPRAVIELADDQEVDVWLLDGPVVGVTVGGRHYGAFAPADATWERAGRRLSSDLAGKGFFSVAALPDGAPETLETFRRHAYAFVTDTRVDWRYDEDAGLLATRYRLTTELKEPGGGRVDAPLVALYRHQWLHTDAPFAPFAYRSPRGEMKVVAATELSTSMPYAGVLPVLPVPPAEAGYDRRELRALIREVYRGGDLFPVGPDGAKDSYWAGKAMGRLAVLVHLADQLGYLEARDQFLQAIKNELEDWFDGRAPNALYYDQTWRTVIGMPSAYFSGAQLNDHHFHYGYFVFAAAAVAHHDPDWAGPARWGPMIELLIKDAANWDRDDHRFPFLRYFDPYAGHSWANGPALFADGNNQESSSEDVNFSVAAILWGTVTGDRAVRDLGIYLLVNQVAAIEQYWFDVDGEVFPEGFGRGALGILWGSGGAYDTWWDPNPIYVHGINFLPFTGGSLYLGRRPDYVRRNYQELVEANRGEPRQWRDLFWMYLALVDADRAAALLERDRYFAPEYGNSRAALHHWIHTLRLLGPPAPTITADHPTATAFERAGVRSYAVYNPSASEITVRFSDGASLTAPPRSFEQWSARAAGPAASARGGN